ncbi:MAG: DUF2127 domain-containing protein [Patescibacteria group bacterium]
MKLPHAVSHAIWRLKDHSAHYFDRPLGLVLIIAYKFIWGATEVYIGILLMFSYPIFSRELAEDPQDLLAHAFIRNLHFSKETLIQIGSLFLSFGIIKVLLAACLWLRLRYIREVGLVVFIATGLYGLGHIVSAFSWVTLAGLVADATFIYYFWKILPKHLNPMDQKYE